MEWTEQEDSAEVVLGDISTVYREVGWTDSMAGPSAVTRGMRMNIMR